jgi:hypothetical protein
MVAFSGPHQAGVNRGCGYIGGLTWEEARQLRAGCFIGRLSCFPSTSAQGIPFYTMSARVTTALLEWQAASNCYWTETGTKGRAKLSSWPSGSIRWKKRSPHSALWGTVAGSCPAASARS